jgi:hypothetical protein
MSKRLVVCCDGTWNAPDERRTGVAAPTSVAKLALALRVGDGVGQRVHYEAGVGITPEERILGGAFRHGLSRNIRSCYRSVALNYEKGDQRFLLGFSRGAYTARSLASLIFGQPGDPGDDPGRARQRPHPRLVSGPTSIGPSSTSPTSMCSARCVSVTVAFRS